MNPLLYIYFAGAAVTLIVAIWLSHKERVATPWLLTIFIVNEVTMILFGLLWPVLAPLVIAEIILRGRSRTQKRKLPDDMKHNP